jgi:RHS repeat-associated protein
VDSNFSLFLNTQNTTIKDSFQIAVTDSNNVTSLWNFVAIIQPSTLSPGSASYTISGFMAVEPKWPSGTIKGTLTTNGCQSITYGTQCAITTINVTDSYSGLSITTPGSSALILYKGGEFVFAGQWGFTENITNGLFTLSKVFQNSPGQPNSGWVYTTGPCPVGPPICNSNQYAGLFYITPDSMGPAQTVGLPYLGKLLGGSSYRVSTFLLTPTRRTAMATTDDLVSCACTNVGDDANFSREGSDGSNPGDDSSSDANSNGPSSGNNDGSDGGYPMSETSSEGTDNQTIDSSSSESVGWAGDTGDPISIGTGNVHERITDYRTAGPNKLQFIRYYNSLSADSTSAVMLGQHWRSNFDRYINISSPTSVTVERADGQQLIFSFSNGKWIGDSDVNLVLTQSGSAWTLVDTSDVTETYTAIGASKAVLTKITARNGFQQNLQYNASNQITSVADSFGRILSFSYQGALLESVTTPDGLVLSYTFNSSGTKSNTLDRLVSVTYSTTPATARSYAYELASLPFALTGITDENGIRYASWTYDSSSRGLSSQHAGGAGLTRVTYNDKDGSRTVTNALGQQTLYKYTILQGVPKLTEVDRYAAVNSTSVAAFVLGSVARTVNYDGNGYVASATDWNGNTTTYVNDAQGRPTTINRAIAAPQVRTSTVTYHPTFHLPVTVVSPGLTTTFSYDSSGNLLTKTLTDTTTNAAPYSTKGSSRTWTYTWSNFQLASVLGPRTDVKQLTKYSYDASGALISITNALGQIIKTTKHTPGGWPETVIDANGVTTNFTYDTRMRLLTRTVQSAAGMLTTAYSYDAAGNLVTVSLPDGSAITRTYDAAHRLVGITDLLKQNLSFTLDAHGDRTKTTLTDGGGTIRRSWTDSFDELARLSQHNGAASQATALTYDDHGNRIGVVDPLGRITTRTFDALNRLTKVIDPLKGTTSFTYNSQNRITAITDPNGSTTNYTYDGFGDLIQEASPSRGTLVYRYDSGGNRVQRIDGRGAITNYSYDALNRRQSITYPAAAGENVTYTYDESGHGFGVGRLTSVTDAAGTLGRSYDDRGNLIIENRKTTSANLQITYSYDQAGRLSSVLYPSGTTITYARDMTGRITGVSAKLPGRAEAVPIVLNVNYLPFGPINSLTYGNGIIETRSFDLDYRMTSLISGSIQSLTYGYDAVDNVLSITDGNVASNSQTFSYDVLNRLAGANGGYGAFGYTYDANGNRVTENPTSHAGISLPLDGLGSVTALTYNQTGRLATVSAGGQQVTQYTYDAMGHRLAKSGSATGQTFFQYDASGNLLEEADGQGTAQIDYIYLQGRPIAEINVGKLYFVHTDRLGTPQTATDGSQRPVWTADFLPFGQLNQATSQTATLGQDLRLPGQENDLETGFSHNGFREYMPGLGRYSQSDPNSLLGGPNTFSYGKANPVRNYDKFGLQISEVEPDPNEEQFVEADPSPYYRPSQNRDTGQSEIDTSDPTTEKLLETLADYLDTTASYRETLDTLGPFVQGASCSVSNPRGISNSNFYFENAR